MWSDLVQRWNEDNVRREGETRRDVLTQSRIRILLLVIAKSLSVTFLTKEEVSAAVTAITVASLVAFEDAAAVELSDVYKRLPPAVAQCVTQTVASVRHMWTRLEVDADWNEWIDSL